MEAGAGVKEVLSYAQQRRDEFLAELQRFLRQPSISASGEGVHEAARLLAEIMENHGLDSQVLPVEGGHPVVYAEIDVGAPVTLLFYNHYDVQPVEPLEQWEVEPFAGEVRDGLLIARGTADNKGSLMARVQAIGSYVKSGRSLPVNVKFFVEGEEEVGSPNLAAAIEKYKDKLKADFVIWEMGQRNEQGGLDFALGCKGLAYIELVARGTAVDLHSSYAAVAPSAAWRLHQALGTLFDNDTGHIKVPSFYDDVAAPTDSELAMLEAAPFNERTLRTAWGVDRWRGDVEGVDFARRLLYEPTCNIAGLTSGYGGPGTKTVLPAEARAKLDLRLVPNQRADVVIRLIKDHLARAGFGDIEVIVHAAVDPARSDPDHPYIEYVLQSARETYGVEPTIRPRWPGTGPFALFTNLGLPVLNGVGVAHQGSLVHAPNENIKVEDYHLGVEHVIRLLDVLGKKG